MTLARLSTVEATAVPATPVDGAPGVTIRWLVGPEQGAPHFAMRLFEMQPGAEIPLHHHWYEQEMYMLAGRGRCRTSENERELSEGDAVWVAPEQEHGFSNPGPEVVRFICCVPLAKAPAKESTKQGTASS